MPVNAHQVLQQLRRRQHAENLGIVTALLSARKRPPHLSANRSYYLGTERYRKLLRWYPDQEAINVLDGLEQLGRQLSRPVASGAAEQLQASLTQALRTRLGDPCILSETLENHCRQRLSALLQQLAGSQSAEPQEHRQSLRRLISLLHFLPEAQQLLVSVPATAKAFDLLTALLRWQSASACRSAGGCSTVQRQLESLIDSLVTHCRHSDWTLEYFVRQGMVVQCRGLLLLAVMTLKQDRSHQLACVCHALLAAHLRAASPTADQQLKLVKALLLLKTTCDGEPQAADDLLAEDCFFLRQGSGNVRLIRSELQQHLERIRAGLLIFSSEHGDGGSPGESRAATLVSQLPAIYRDALQTVMHSCYKLVWILQAMRMAALSRHCHCLLSVMQQYALLLSRLPPAVLHSLDSFCQQLEACCNAAAGAGQQETEPESTVMNRLLQLLQQWPEKPYLPLAELVPAHQGSGSQLRSADELFQFLSVRFTTLLSVNRNWFADRDSYMQQAGRLHAELAGLEQSSALLRLPDLASLAGKLLQIDCLHSLPGAVAVFPASLLLRGYQELARLLDCAAAWQPVLPDLKLQQDIDIWLVRANDSLHRSFAEESRNQGRNYLQLGIQCFAAQLRLVFGHEIRIAGDLDTELAFSDQQAVLSLLQILLRELLLQRRCPQGKRQSMVLSLDLRLESGEQCLMCCLQGPDSLPVPQGRQLRHLLRQLGSRVTDLSCQSAGQQQRTFRLRIGRQIGEQS